MVTRNRHISEKQTSKLRCQEILAGDAVRTCALPSLRTRGMARLCPRSHVIVRTGSTMSFIIMRSNLIVSMHFIICIQMQTDEAASRSDLMLTVLPLCAGRGV